MEQKSASLISDEAGDVAGVRGRNPNRKRDIFKFDSRQLQQGIPGPHLWITEHMVTHAYCILECITCRSLTLELLASMSDSLKIRFIFLCGLRGYHKYHSVWTPTLQEVLEAKQESGNPYIALQLPALESYHHVCQHRCHFGRA